MHRFVGAAPPKTPAVIAGGATIIIQAINIYPAARLLTHREEVKHATVAHSVRAVGIKS